MNFGSWRAPEPGNRLGRSLAIKPTYGGRTTVQTVTRVELEQASKVVVWTPTRFANGEGCTDREETRAEARHSPTNDNLSPSRVRYVIRDLIETGAHQF